MDVTLSSGLYDLGLMGMSLGILVGRFGDFVREHHEPPEVLKPESPFPPHLNELRDRVGLHLIPLVLIARSDRAFLPAERMVIVGHCLKIADDAGIALDGSEKDLLDAYVDDFYPTIVQLEPALHRLSRAEHAEIAALLEAAHELLLADADMNARKRQILVELRDDLSALAG
jgi:hypothetical protein